MKDIISNRESGVCGILAPFVMYLSIQASIILNPWFSFPNCALSDLGAFGRNYFIIFNIGMIFSGLLFLTFSFKLPVLTNGKLGNIGSKIFLIGAVLMSLVGVFPKGSEVHTPVAVIMFGMYFFGIVFVAIDQFLEEATRVWSVFIFSTLILTVSSVFLVFLVPYNLEPAIPETLGILFLSNFSFVFGMRILGYL